MKRRAALLQLSRDHHTALVLAQRIARAADETAVATLMTTVPATFSREIEPHFLCEEGGLLPRLEAAGKGGLVRRTLEEHRTLRELVARIAAGDRTCLKAFGSALHDHVRFEERELFAVAEAVLPAEFLDRAAPAADEDLRRGGG